MNDLMQMLQTAAANGDWVYFVAALLALAVPMVLQLMGKKVPLVDTLIKLAIDILQKFRPPKSAPVLPPESQPGLGSVVSIVPPVKDDPKP